MPRRQRSATTSSGNTSQLPNIDADEEEDLDEGNDEDENEGGKSNPEEDD